MQMAIHADEDFLNQILGALAITDRAIDEVQQAGLIPFDQLLKGAFFAAEKRGDDASVVLRFEFFSCRCAWQLRAFKSDFSHVSRCPLALRKGTT